MIALALLVACPQTTSQAAVDRAVVAVRVEPAELSVRVSPGAPVEATFEAIGTFGNGDEDVLDLVTWELSNASIGAINSRGEFTSVDTNGGSGSIVASHLEFTASASLTVIYAEALLDDGVDGDVVAAFDASSPTEDPTLSLVYPLDGATIPRNLAGLVFSWEGAAEGDVARLQFTSELTDISAYTNGSTWEVPTDLWEIITATNKRGEVSVTVTVGQWDGSTVQNPRVSPAISLAVNRLDATGSITYWSLYDGRIMRMPTGGVEATAFYPTEETTDCYGCHSISEKRQWMVATRDGVDGQYKVLDVSDPDNIVEIYNLHGDKRMTFKTLSPDGLWMVGTYRAGLVIYDLPNNELLDTPTLDGLMYENPDWSPAGDQIVAVRLSDPIAWASDMFFYGGEIVLIPWDGATMGEPEVLVPAIEGITQYYPAFSPDGRYIVFNRSTGDSNADLDAELWIVDALGGEPVRLDNANGVEDQQNSLARWAPLPDDDILWLAYSSKRPYPLEDAGPSQIWVTAIDPARMAEGSDPSYPPYWMPGQRSDSDNHLPLWWSQ